MTRHYTKEFRTFRAELIDRRILEFLKDHNKHDHHYADITRGTGITYKVLNYHIQNLLKNKVVKVTRKVGISPMYQLTEWSQNI
jgi:DNA-binding Lrp family transcriptional regulator